MTGVFLWLGVGVLGGVGAVCRVVVDGVVAARARAVLPLGILIVNVGGSLVLGLLVGLAVRGDAYLLAGTALIGGYTTFSTWMLQTVELEERDHRREALLNVALSVLLGLGAAALGRWLGGG